MSLTVHAAGRDAAALDQLAQEAGCSPVIAADVGALRSAIGALELDILVNNAGVGRAGSMLDDAAIGIDEQVDVNPASREAQPSPLRPVSEARLEG